MWGVMYRKKTNEEIKETKREESDYRGVEREKESIKEEREETKTDGGKTEKTASFKGFTRPEGWGCLIVTFYVITLSHTHTHTQFAHMSFCSHITCL